MHDVVIIGGGPAGLTAGIYAVRRGLTTLILEKKVFGGQILLTNDIENYPGFSRISGGELAERMRSQAEILGVEFASEKALSFELSGQTKKVRTKEKEYEAKALIIATGGEYRKLGAKGEKELTGRGVSYCATCDAPFFKGRAVAVIGGGNKAVSDALFMSEIAQKTYLIHRRDSLRAEEKEQEKLREKGVEVILDSVVEEFSGEPLLQEMILRDVKTGKDRRIDVNGAFISIGTVPHTEAEAKAGVELDGFGFIKVDCDQQTNMAGVFAAGDVTGGVMQVATAVGEGCVAALSAYKHIKDPYWRN